MIDALHHRGPDGRGVYRDGDVTLLSTRLKIFDLSDRGAMPMQDGNVVLVYNGEIYNYLDLRNEIGGEWKTGTDTEVVLRAYQKWGISCLSRLNGMFAFCLHDHLLGATYLVRDRLGIKPLYYVRLLSGVTFASEPQLLGSKPNEDTVRRFIVDGRYDDTTETFFDGVNSLGAGQYMVIHDNRTVTETYWTPQGPSWFSASDYMDILEDAVRIRCRADVPRAVMLSGGLDSSIIAHMAGLESAITVLYGDRATDEVEHASRVAQHIGISNHMTPEVDPWFVQEYFSDVTRALGEPFGGLAVFGDYLAARLARKQGIYVLLEGQGADECWGGYSWYDKVDDGTRRARMLQDLRSTKLPRVLRFKDRASMEHGVELRVPFLDHRLVEASMGLNRDDITGKAGLRREVEGRLPLDVVYADKRSRVTPQTKWLRYDLQSMVGGMLDRFLDRGLVDKEVVTKRYSEFVEHGADNSAYWWRLLSLEQWYREFID